jgi:uncharacterized protein (TIGR03435 family)
MRSGTTVRVTARFVVAVAVWAAFAITLGTQERPQFEVASVRPSPDQRPAQAGVQLTPRLARFSSLSMKDYLGIAYTVRIHQIAGPEWMGNVRFDIAATLPESFKPEQLAPMLQVLLENRFQMQVHREQREFSVYALEVASGGSKLVKSQEGIAAGDAFEVKSATSGGSTVVDLGQGASVTLGNNRFDARKVTMTMLADLLARFVDRPVVDRTNIEGRYDLAFELTPQDFQAMMLRSAVASGAAVPPQALQLLDTASHAAIPDALKGFGLSLESRRAPLEVLVIDRIERAPTEN